VHEVHVAVAESARGHVDGDLVADRVTQWDCFDVHGAVGGPDDGGAVSAHFGSSYQRGISCGLVSTMTVFSSV
jgi:hypothetical protein